MTARSPVRARLRSDPAVWLFMATLAAFLCIQRGAVTASDGARMLAVTRSIVEDVDLSVADEYGVRGRDGQQFSKYGLGLSVVALPGVALAHLAGAVVGHQRDLVDFAAASVMPVVAAGLVVAQYRLGLALGASRRASLLVGAGTMAGTFALPYGKDFFSELLVTLLLSVAVERSLRDRPGASGAALAAAVLTRPQAALLAVPWAAWAIWRWRGRALAGVLWVGGGIGLAAVYNWLRFGSFTETGYRGESFTTPLLDGLGELFLEQRKSVLLFAPAVVLVPIALRALHRTHPDAVWLLGVNLVATLLTTALWWDPGGGYSWGPRLLLPGLLPALVALAPWAAAAPGRARATTALFGLGFLVSASTLIVAPQAQQLDQDGSDSPRVVRQYELVPDVVQHTIDERGRPSERGEGAGRRFVDVWPVMVGRVLGTPAMLAAFVAAAALAVLAWLAGRVAWRLAAPSP